MKIKIKSREEIEKTLDDSNYHVNRSGAYLANPMFLECGKIIEANPLSFLGYSARADCSTSPSGGWNWHPDWYEVIDPDFTDEDLMDIEFMNEMLSYFLEARCKK